VPVAPAGHRRPDAAAKVDPRPRSGGYRCDWRGQVLGHC
jgi:hypothetical protein